jgi:hypothetical protein
MGEKKGRAEEGLGIVPDDPEQYRRFVEAARELGADGPEAGGVFDRALRRVLPAREPGKPAPRREGWSHPRGPRGGKKSPE